MCTYGSRQILQNITSTCAKVHIKDTFWDVASARSCLLLYSPCRWLTSHQSRMTLVRKVSPYQMYMQLHESCDALSVAYINTLLWAARKLERTFLSLSLPSRVHWVLSIQSSGAGLGKIVWMFAKQRRFSQFNHSIFCSEASLPPKLSRRCRITVTSSPRFTDSTNSVSTSCSGGFPYHSSGYGTGDCVEGQDPACFTGLILLAAAARNSHA